MSEDSEDNTKENISQDNPLSLEILLSALGIKKTEVIEKVANKKLRIYQDIIQASKDKTALGKYRIGELQNIVNGADIDDFSGVGEF